MAVDAAVADSTRAVARRGREKPSIYQRIRDYLPQGNMLDDDVWRRRHRLLRWFLILHIPVLIPFGLFMRQSLTMLLITVAPIPVFWMLSALPYGRRVKSFFATAGIVYGAAALVVLSNGAIEAHFEFFVLIGFIALYQDWVPFGWNVAFTVLSHGLGSAFRPGMIFNTMAGMDHPWIMSFVHGFAVLMACVGVVLFWRTNEDEQQKTLTLTEELSAAEIARRRFTSDLLVNLARRNQSMLYRQLDIINQLEEKEQDPDALFELFRLDHLATRIRRNAENLLVLSGAEPPRVWGKPVPLTDVVRAAIAETEDLSRVTFSVDERLTVAGQAVIDLTHLLAELIENAVRFSPPESRVTVRTSPDVRSPGSIMFTVEDWGVGMPPEDLADANRVLAEPREVDALVSNRLGLHVISRLAHRYSIQVVLTATSGSGITAVLLLPPALLMAAEHPQSAPMSSQSPAVQVVEPRRVSAARQRQLATPPVTVEPWIEPPAAAPPIERAPVYVPAPQPVSQPQPQLRPQPQLQLSPQSAAPPVTRSIQVDRLGSASSWDGWWEPDAALQPDAPAATSSARPAPAVPPVVMPVALPAAPAIAVAIASDGPAVRLTRRTPQTHLAPELQRGRQTGSTASRAPVPSAAPAGPPPDAERAREALSRYQASRQAALAEHGTAERNRS